MLSIKNCLLLPLKKGKKDIKYSPLSRKIAVIARQEKTGSTLKYHEVMRG
jgi:hypothetical protein